MRPTPNDTILDIGCGTGGTVHALSREFRCIGLDTSKNAIDFATQKYPGCDFRIGEAAAHCEALSEDTALFTLMDVLEHLPDDRQALQQVIDSARPGSHILITVPANPALWSQHDISAEHYRRYTAESLQELWAGLPVTIKLFSYFNHRLYWPIKLALTLGRWFPLFSGEDGGNLRLPPTPLNFLLANIFAGEKKALLFLLSGNNTKEAYRSGVSLIALLQCS